MPGFDNLYRTLNLRPQMQAALPAVGDEDLTGMLSDGDVADMQDDDLQQQEVFNAHLPVDPITNEKRGVLSLRSGYDTKQQGLSALRRTLGADRIKTKSAMDLNNNTAKNAVALEAQREGSAERIAAKNAEVANARIASQQSFQADQNEKNRQAVTGRTVLSQGNTMARAATAQAGQNMRQASGQNETRAKALEAQAAKIGALGNMFGAKDRLLKQAADLRAQHGPAIQPASGGDPEVAAAAADFHRAYPNASPDQVLRILQQTQTGTSPEDVQALYDAIVGGQ